MIPLAYNLRLQHLEDNIEQDLNLLKEYETLLRYEDNPRSIYKYRREIENLRESISRYQNEYDNLRHQIFQIIVEYYESEERPMIKLIAERLTPDKVLSLEAILEAVEMGQMSESETIEVLEQTQKMLIQYQPKNILPPAEGTRILEIFDSGDFDLKYKLKVALPIIPIILQYESEMNLVDIKEVWQKLVQKIRDKYSSNND